MNIGKRIKELRIEQSFKSGDFAQKVGITPVYLSYLESEAKRPSIDTLVKICSVLGITLSDFFSNEDSIPSEIARLIYEVKDLRPEQAEKLLEFIKTMK